MTRNQKIILGVLAALILGGGYYVVLQPKNEGASKDVKGVIEDASKKETATSSTKDKGYTINVEPVLPPTLDRPIVIKVQMTAQSKVETEKKIQELKTRLQKDSTQHPLWLDLAAYWRIIGDYDAARQVWEYVTQIWPSDSVAYSNLGTLYAENIKDPIKAEGYFLQAISKDPAYGYSYIQLAEFYHDILKNDIKARETLQKGISASPAHTAEFKMVLEAYGG